MNDVQAIKCNNCGAPAFFEQGQARFRCPYCGDFVPMTMAQSHFAPQMSFRHRPIPVIDGLLKLTHVGMSEKPVTYNPGPPDTSSTRTRGTDNKLAGIDFDAFASWTGREMIILPCKHCGATITGYSTQNIFECAYCKNKVMDAEAYTGGVYRQEVFGYDRNMYNLALPFTVTEDEAKQQILRIAAEYPKDFAGQDIRERLETNLQAIYLPYRLMDVSLKATVETEKGKFTFYHDRINWALPQFTLLDIYLLNELHPWDFGCTAPFTPAFLEGNVRIFAPLNNESRKTAMSSMLLRDAPAMIQSAFGVKKAKLLTWEYNFREHKYAHINLPIWFLDKDREDGYLDLQIRAAVNGQTGKAAALFLQTNKKDYVRVCEKSFGPQMSDECTIFSPPTPIAYVKSPHLYQVISFEEAVKKPGLFSKWFR